MFWSEEVRLAALPVVELYFTELHQSVGRLIGQSVS